MTIGILALQGDVREHAAALAALGVDTRPVRRPAELTGLRGLVLPGGESTTLSMLLESSGLFGPLAAALAGGLPVLGTCAGLVLLSGQVLDGRADQRCFGVLDCTVRRNGYGRQLESFESAVTAEGSLRSVPGEPTGVTTASAPAPILPAVFIRAPVIESVGPGVEVLARLGAGSPGDGGGGDPGRPVACRQGRVVATAFHPELTTDRRVHRLFVGLCDDEVPAVRSEESVGVGEDRT